MSRLPFLALGLLVAAAWSCSVNAAAAEVTPASDKALTPALSQGEREKETPNPAITLAATIDQRFAAKPEEVPDFRRHVVPLFGRSGCNGRACHGSFQGQGGFRLSLFGYDFKADHDALLASKPPRADLANPPDSLMLKKPTLQVEHEGKLRFKKDSWQYNVILRWIEAGAKPVAKDAANLKQLEIKPAELVFSKPGETRQLHVIAHWTDGSSEEVTPICRFRCNDEQIAKIDENGLVTALEKGDTDAVAFYDIGVATIPVLLPVSDLVGPHYPSVAATTKIDALVVAKLRKLGVVPSEQADDAEFLRRVTIDITGTLPTPADIDKFLNDSSADKRKRKIDELLERPAYAAWWATKLCDLTGNAANTLQGIVPQNAIDQRVANNQWYEWIEARLRENKPYDELAAGLILGNSREAGQSYEEFCASATASLKEGSDAFIKRPTMPYYWARQNFRKPDEMAMGFAYTFLGIRIQCAQCHKHPFDQWSKQDFEQFTKFFTRVGVGVAPEDKDRQNKMLEELGLRDSKDKKDKQDKKEQQAGAKKVFAQCVAEGKPFPWPEVYSIPPKGQQRKGNAKAPTISGKLLGGDVVDLTEVADPRQSLMDWLRHEPNGYFARSMVNRVWASYFNVGIVEPPDDLSLANPASNGPLLDYLTQAFIDHKFDLKWLHREIVNSATYQRHWRPNATNAGDQRNFSHAVPRRLPAEVAYDALTQATANDAAIAEMQEKMQVRAIGPTVVDQKKKNPKQQSSYLLAAFGKPTRTVNCDCDRSPDPTLLQTIFLRNDSELFALLDRNDSWIKQMTPLAQKNAKIAQPFDVHAAVRSAYLRTLSRPPTAAEFRGSRDYIAAADKPIDGLRDLMWALLNTKEFIVNH